MVMRVLYTLLHYNIAENSKQMYFKFNHFIRILQMIAQFDKFDTSNVQ